MGDTTANLQRVLIGVGGSAVCYFPFYVGVMCYNHLRISAETLDMELSGSGFTLGLPYNP
jgi:hypothetical protein